MTKSPPPKATKNPENNNAADRLDITYYTDPLCCWSWALEQHWLRLREERGHAFTFRYVMGGMIPSWESYNDPLNSVCKPLQMGPMWMHASQITNTPIDYTLWHTDAPSSSYPSCIAVKCAGLQSAMAEDLYLQRLRRATMQECKNIAKQSVLIALAKEIATNFPNILNFEQFENDIKNGNGRECFRNDLQEAAFHKVGRFPTLAFTNQKSGNGIMIIGYRPYGNLLKVFDLFQSNETKLQM